MSDILCRVCLRDEASISIFESEKDLTNKFYVCFGEEILDLPGYPKGICEECYCLISKAVLLINKYKDSCLILETRLKTVIKEERRYSVDCSDEIPNDVDDFVDKKENIESELVLFHIKDDKNANEIALGINKPGIPLPSKTKTDILSSNKNNMKSYNTGSGTASALKRKLSVMCKNGEISIKSPEKSSKSKKQKFGVKNADKKINLKNPKGKKSEETKKQEKQVTSEKLPSPILCEHCGKSFNAKYKLQLHIGRSHSEKKALECPECKKKYPSEYALSRHIKRIHPKEKKLCSDCGKAFAVNCELEKHYKAVHLKIRSYKMHPCKFCGKEYITAKSLIVHTRSVHTGERPAVCSVCDASFVHEEYLTQHMRLHTGETPFKCPVCARGYAQSGNMKSHIKHNHSISQLDELTIKTINPRYLKFMKP